MSYGLPTRGQADWDDELNNSIENLRGKADAAAADASNAVSTANSATNLALAADARSRKAASGVVGDVLGEPFGAAELDSSGRLPEGQVPDRLTEPSLNATFGQAVSLAKYLPLGNTGSGLVAAAFADAATEAGVGGTIFIPKYMGAYTLDAAVSLTDISIESDGATINVTTGVTTTALTLTSAGSAPYTFPRGFNLVGPGARSLGAKTAGCDGIRITGQAKPSFQNVVVQNFDSGFDLANDVGHIYFRNVTATNNYYGVYVSKNTFDYYFTDCLINGNTFANFATAADQGFAAMRLDGVHCGFAPYGFYQEPTPANQGKPKVFMQDVHMQHVRFEAIGNAAIYTESQLDATNASIASDVTIRYPGFSWSSTYRIAARDKDYAIVFAFTERRIEIVVGSNGFTTGDLNVYRIKQGAGQAFLLIGANTQVATTQVVTDTGNANVLAFAAPLANGSSPTFAQVDITSGAYLRFSGNNVRFGGDTTSFFADFNGGGYSWRNAAADYATVGKVVPTGISMPTYFLASGGGTTGPRLTSGTGSPEGVVTAPVGSTYSRTDGGAGTSFYVKESGTGNTGWVGK